MRIEEDHISAEMERLRTRRLWRAFAGGADPGGPRSMLGRGLLASLILAVLLVLGAFAVGVIGAAGDDAGGGSPVAPTTTTSIAPSSQRVAVAVPSTEYWTDTGVDVSAGDRVRVEATGTVTAGSSDPLRRIGPDGTNDPAFTRYNRYVRNDGDVRLRGGHAALIGRIGDEDEPRFVIGAHRTVRVDADGRLFLGVNDGELDNNGGEFEISLTIDRAAP
jgi:hypothetical protein